LVDENIELSRAANRESVSKKKIGKNIERRAGQGSFGEFMARKSVCPERRLRERMKGCGIITGHDCVSGEVLSIRQGMERIGEGK